jgi:hypothetical protein
MGARCLVLGGAPSKIVAVRLSIFRFRSASSFVVLDHPAAARGISLIVWRRSGFLLLGIGLRGRHSSHGHSHRKILEQKDKPKSVICANTTLFRQKPIEETDEENNIVKKTVCVVFVVLYLQ